MSYRKRSKSDVDYINAILKEGTFRKAADSLYISQPALSQYIERIENEFGIQLFNRNVKPVTLTEEGRIFLETEKKIESLRRVRKTYFENLNNLETGKIRIGTNQCRTVTLLAEPIRNFVKDFPNIQIELIETPAPEISKKILNGDIDLGITLDTFMLPDVDSRLLKREKLLLATPQEEKWKNLASPVDFSLFEHEYFILLNRGVMLHDAFYELCEKHKVFPKVLLETESITTVLELVSMGLGCGLVPNTLIEMHKVVPRPFFFSLGPDVISNNVHVVWNKHQYLSKGARKIIDYLVEYHHHTPSMPIMNSENEI